MQNHLLSPELTLISLFLSIFFLIGVVRFFFSPEIRPRLVLLAVSYYAVAYTAYLLINNYLYPLGFFRPREELLNLNILTIFLSFSLLSMHKIIPRLKLLPSFVILLVLGGFLFPFFFESTREGLFHRFSLNDQGGFSFLFFGSGSVVWFFEVFFGNPQSKPTQSEFGNGDFFFFLAFPISLLICFGSVEIEATYKIFVTFFLGTCFAFLGISIMMNREGNQERMAILALISVTSFLSFTVSESLFLHLPLCFAIGVFLPLIMNWLGNRGWSDNGKLTFVSLFLSGVMGLFSPFLVVASQKWPHPPLVMLGVHSLYLLTIFLLSCFAASLIYILPKEDES